MCVREACIAAVCPVPILCVREKLNLLCCVWGKNALLYVRKKLNLLCCVREKNALLLCALDLSVREAHITAVFPAPVLCVREKLNLLLCV